MAMTTDNRTNEPTEAQIEAAAKGIHALTEADPFEDYHPSHKQELRDIARAALVAAQGAAPQAESAHQHEWDAETTPPRMTCQCAAPVLPSSGVDEDACWHEANCRCVRERLVDEDVLAEVIGSLGWGYMVDGPSVSEIARAVAEWLKGQGNAARE